jgi:hypothetical protein
MTDAIEDIVLLQLDYTGGSFNDRRLPGPEVAVAGAAVMELALRYRVDADLDRLFIADLTPTGDSLLDDALEQLSRVGAEFTARSALEGIVDHAGAYRQTALQRLLDKGVVREQSGRYLRCDDRAQRELTERLRHLLMTDEIPDPGDVMLVALIDACGLLGLVLRPAEVGRTRARVDQISRLDLIAQAVSWAVAALQLSLQ